MATLQEASALQSETVEEVSVELVEPVRTKRKYRKVKPLNYSRNKGVRAKEAKVLELAAKNIPIREISKIVGLPESTVGRKIQEYSKVFTELENIKDYRDLKTDILSAAELAALKAALDPKNLSTTSMLNGAKAFEIFNKANRLEQDLSTSNEAHKFFGKVSIVSSTTTKKDPE